MMMGGVDSTCPECHGKTIARSTLPGFARCEHCGSVFIPPEKDAFKEAPPPEERVSREEVELEEEVKVPDQVEVVYGWRAWGVRPPKSKAGLAVLQSVTYGQAFWTPRSPMVATCDRSDHHLNRADHDPPGETCSCGLYSAKTLQHLMSMGYHRYDAEAKGMFHVIGKVALWGKVIPGTQGWRAEIGYPAELYLPFEAWHLHEQLTESYGVPVMLKNFLK